MEKTPNVKTINNVSTFTNPTLKPAGKLSILTKNTTRNNFHPCCGGASYDFTCKAEKNICAPIKIKIKPPVRDRKSTRLNSCHVSISYAVFCLKKKTPTRLQYTR